MKRSLTCLPAALLIATSLMAQENGGHISLLNGLNSFTNSSSKDSVYFLKGGINLGIQGNYFWKSIGIAGRVGYFTNNASEEKLAEFGESRKASPERALIATKPYKGFYFMAGPAFQTTFSRWQVESNVLGGMFNHDDGGVFIGDRATPDLVYYRNKIDAGSAFAWNVGFGVNYAISAPIRLGLSADYLSTQSSVTNTDINRNNGQATQSLTSQANFLSTALKLTYSLNKSDNRNTWRKSTVKSNSSNPGKIAPANNGTTGTQKNNDCDCENKVRDMVYLDPLTVDITFTNLAEAQNFLKSTNPLYEQSGNSGQNPMHTTREAGSGMATGRRQHKPVTAGYDDVTNTFELNGKYYVATAREKGSGMATGRRQYEPLKSAVAGEEENDNAGALQGMMVRTNSGEQVFALLPLRIDLQRVSYLQGGAISVHVKNESGEQNVLKAQNNNTVRSNRTNNALIGNQDPNNTGNNSQQKVADHNSSRSNKSSSLVDKDDNTETDGQNTLKAQNNNTVRSNRTDNALKSNQDPNNTGNNSQQKVADHNSSRSNKTSSVIDKDDNTETDGQNTLKAQNNNTVRSNRTDNALKSSQDPNNTGNNSQQKVADHNSSRSNKSSSVIDKDDNTETDGQNSQQKVADHNSSRSNKSSSLIDNGGGNDSEEDELLDLVLYTDAAGKTSAKIIRNNTYTTREAGSGLATGRRQHYPLKADWNETDDVITIGDYSFHNIKSPRDASSGMATGKRQHKPVTALYDDNTNTLEMDGQYYTAVSPRDASSGLATGRRQHKPMTVMFDEDNDEIDINGTIYKEVITAREKGSGMSTGRRTSFAALLGNPNSSATQRVLPTVNKKTMAVRLIAGDEATAKAIVTNNTTRGGSATLNSQSSSTRTKQTQGSSFGEKMLAGDPIPGLDVILKKANGQQITTSTDENGFILADNLTEGEYEIQQVYTGNWKYAAVAVKVKYTGNEVAKRKYETWGDPHVDTKDGNRTTQPLTNNNDVVKRREVWGDPHVDTKDGYRTTSSGNGVVYKINNTKPVRCANGQCELLCTVIVDGKEHEAVVTAVIKSTHEMQMSAIRNLK